MKGAAFSQHCTQYQHATAISTKPVEIAVAYWSLIMDGTYGRVRPWKNISWSNENWSQDAEPHKKNYEEPRWLMIDDSMCLRISITEKIDSERLDMHIHWSPNAHPSIVPLSMNIIIK